MKPNSHPSPEQFRFAILAVDVALLAIKDGILHVRMMRVDRPPHFPEIPGLPGGIVTPSETAEETAKRITEQKGLVRPELLYFEQLYTFSTLNRDPRGRVVAIAYLAFVSWDALSSDEQSNTDAAFWKPVKQVLKANLAYDHHEILRMAYKRVRSRITYTTLIAKLMPKKFTLSELMSAYECILGKKLDKRNFRKKILRLDILRASKEKKRDGTFRPAELYSFATQRVEEIEVL